jgi:hypothetical protein
MSEYRKWQFVCSVLDALARGDEVVIDGRQIFRLDTTAYALRDECAEVRRLVEKLRTQEPLSTDVVGELRLLREVIVRTLEAAAAESKKKKGRKS